MRPHGSLYVDVVTEPMFQVNSYLLWVRGGSQAWVIDPGLPPAPQKLLEALSERKLSLDAIVLTHCHADHIAGVGDLCRAFPTLKLYAPRDEQHMLTDADANLSAPFGFHVVTPAPQRLVRPGDTLQLDPLTWQALDVAGHSPGGLAYYSAEAGVVFTGDSLFAGNIGRYDFPGSSGTRLLQNIRENLLSLPDATVVYSGHGPATTIGDERENNPCLQDDFLG